MAAPEIGGDGHLEGEPAEGWQAARDGPPNTLEGAVAYLEEQAREHADAGEAAQYLALDAAAQELKQHASQWLPEQPPETPDWRAEPDDGQALEQLSEQLRDRFPVNGVLIAKAFRNGRWCVFAKSWGEPEGIVAYLDRERLRVHRIWDAYAYAEVDDGEATGS